MFAAPGSSNMCGLELRGRRAAWIDVVCQSEWCFVGLLDGVLSIGGAALTGFVKFLANM